VDLESLKKVLELHKRWLEGKPDGQCANLRRTDLRWANLRRTDLRGANLYGAYLSGAHLSGVDLSGAHLGGAHLYEASLRLANRREANLRGAGLHGADLHGADLRGAKFSIAQMFKIDMGYLSNTLTLELMRRDAQVCGIDKMDAWARDGECPFNSGKTRPFLFQERKRVWPVGEANKPTMTDEDLWTAVTKELNITI
jgi:hypothetical protein